MRRAPIVITSTIAGVIAVLSFKPREPALPTVAAATAAAPTTPSATSHAPTSTSKSTSKAKSKSKSSTSTSTSTKTATGDAIATRYGNAQVRVTVSNGKITKIVALQLQGNDPKSVRISSGAEPLLRQSALTKQSAAIDAVSGATFTSASYEASLQSALDKLGFKAADGSRANATVPSGGDQGGGPGGVPPGFSAGSG